MDSDFLTILCGDALEQLCTLPSESVQCCVTSPPYWGLRDYGVAGQLGLEKTPEEFAAKLVAIFEEVRRVLKGNGTCWVNLGDSYASGGRGDRVNELGDPKNPGSLTFARPNCGLKPKDLVGIPWRFAFAAQAAGWYLRSEIIWAKPNPMPESVTDRPTKSHEQIFLLTKSAKYFYDAAAIKEPVSGTAHARGDGVNPKARYKTPDGWDTSKGNGSHGSFHRDGREPGQQGYQHKPRSKQNESFSGAVNELVDFRNKRTVWTVPTFGFPEAHFATFPPDLIKPCILAGSRPGDTVLDPFGGSGTTGQVALELGRKALLIELNPEYVKLIEQRCHITPGLAL